MRFAAWVVVTCFTILLFSPLASAAGKKKAKAKKLPADVDAAALCDICQTSTHWAYTEIKPSKVPKGKNALTLKVQNTLNPSFCENVEKRFADLLDRKNDKFMPTCHFLYDRIEAQLEELIIEKSSEADATSKLCLPDDVCTTLWTPEQHVSKRETPAMRNERVGNEYLAENKKKEGVQVTESGLQYEKLVNGDDEGFPPMAHERVKVHYKGTLVNGEEFDSSYSRGEPTSFGVTEVIAGWTEGLQLMVPGDKFRFVIPWKLAYGESGSGAKIGPRATLVFEVELIEVEGSHEEEEQEEPEPPKEEDFAHGEL